MSISDILLPTMIAGGHYARKRGESYSTGESSRKKDALSMLQAAGTAAMIAPFMSKMSQGALYSIGAEPIVGQHGFGFAYMQENLISKGIKLNEKSTALRQKGAIVSGPKSLFLPNQGIAGSVKTLQVESAELLGTHAAGLGSKLGQGVMKQSLLNSVLPVGMTAWFAADAYASDGMTGLGKYLVADILGNYYGTEAGLFSGIVTDVNKASSTISKMSGATLGTVAATAEGDIKVGGMFQRVNPILRSGMLGRMLPVLGGITGATVGMEVGANAGSAISAMLGYDLDDTMSRVGGGFFGAVVGAKFGSYALSSIARMGLAGAGIMATTAVVSNTMSAIGSGFENINKGRGLNYAGEVAHYFTQNAVTMRERAMQSIHKSHLNARSAFGQEASMMHMNRDMFSQYKRSL